MPSQLDRPTVQAGQPIDISLRGRLADPHREAVGAEPIGARLDRQPHQHLPLDLQRKKGHELAHPRSGGDDRRIEHLGSLRRRHLDASRPRRDAGHLCVAPDIQLADHGRHDRFDAQEAGLRIENSDLAVAHRVAGIAPAQLGSIQHLDLEAVLLRGSLRRHDRLRVGRPDHQQTVQREQLLPGVRLQLAPHPKGLLQQRHVPRAFEIRGARHTRLAVRRPKVMRGREAVEADDLGPAPLQSPTRGGPHRAAADDRDPHARTVTRASPSRWAGRP